MEILEDPGDVQPLNYNKMFMEKEPRISTVNQMGLATGLLWLGPNELLGL